MTGPVPSAGVADADALHLIYETTRTIRHSDVDCHRRLRWSSLFTLLQEAAIDHVGRLGLGLDKTLGLGLLWVVALQNLSIRRLPTFGERVRLRTWPGKPIHNFCPRYYRMSAEDGALLLEGCALWGLMEQNERKLIDLQVYGLRMPFVVTGDELPLPRAPRGGPPTQVAQFTVPYSCLDLNGHMNNARYPELVQDLLPPSLLARDPSQICVEYDHEACLGDVLRIGMTPLADGYFILGETDRRVFRMALRWPAEEEATL